jgi:hypothetical protein
MQFVALHPAHWVGRIVERQADHRLRDDISGYRSVATGSSDHGKDNTSQWQHQPFSGTVVSARPLVIDQRRPKYRQLRVSKPGQRVFRFAFGPLIEVR